MLADIESGHIDGVLAWHPDRLHRQPAELEDLIILIEANDVEIRTKMAGELDLSTPTGRPHARMLGAIAKYEVEHKQERILRKVQELVEAGTIHNGGHRPFGYERIYEGEGPRRKIIEDRIDETEAKYIRDWAKRALEGETLYSLVADANSEGIKTSTGGAWSYERPDRRAEGAPPRDRREGRLARDHLGGGPPGLRAQYDRRVGEG